MKRPTKGRTRIMWPDIRKDPMTSTPQGTTNGDPFRCREWYLSGDIELRGYSRKLPVVPPIPVAPKVRARKLVQR